MRNFFLIALIFGVSFSGCGADDEPTVGGITNVTFTGPVTRSCDGASGNCYFDLNVSFDDTLQGNNYYRLEAYNRDRSWSAQAVMKRNEGNTIQITFSIPYFANLATDAYTANVYRFASKEDAELLENRTGAGSSDNSFFIDSYGGDCGQKCCTPGFYYAGVTRYTQGITEVEAWITHRQGNFCCLCNDAETHYNAYVALVYDTFYTGTEQMAAESGYIAVANPDPTTPLYQGWYGAVTSQFGDQIVYYLDYLPPADQNSKFGVEINPDTSFTFYYNDIPRITKEHYPEWSRLEGDFAYWTGEVSAWETDMPGTDTDTGKCVFSGCKYFDGIGWHALDLSSDSARARTSDPAEWKIEYAPTVFSDRFSISDLNPL
jgi:hypothetical protein